MGEHKEIFCLNPVIVAGQHSQFQRVDVYIWLNGSRFEIRPSGWLSLGVDLTPSSATSQTGALAHR